MDRYSASALLVRLLVYASLAAGVFELLVRAAASSGDSRWLSRDDGPVELVQLAAIVAAAAALAALSRKAPRLSELLRLLACLAMLGAMRELDNLTLQFGWRSGYLWMGLPFALYAMSLLATTRGRLLDQLAVFVRSPAFALLAAGFFIIVIYAQLIGQKVLWIAVLGPDAYRPTKDLIEESSELLGYLLVVFGAAEAWLTMGGQGRDPV
ncbi:MAG: hypothetical protein HY899_07895 [Deltaproteobacteria bacterium]|nr:hypothetical protein [Deltaproteobacteria bacterium]